MAVFFIIRAVKIEMTIEETTQNVNRYSPQPPSTVTRPAPLTTTTYSAIRKISAIAKFTEVAKHGQYFVLEKIKVHQR